MPVVPELSVRRSFLGRLAAGAAVFGTAIATGSSPLQAMAEREVYKPIRHPMDDWFDAIPGKHRIFFDAVSATGAGGALGFANNFAVANKSGYGLDANQLARVICYRHFATCFAFTDAMWQKYGPIWGGLMGFNDPKSNAAPVRNVWNATDLPGMQPNLGNPISMLVADGVHFAVCDMATHFIAGASAEKAGSTADAIYAELKANVIGNSHFVPAGIVAVNRAQERGYTFSYVG